VPRKGPDVHAGDEWAYRKRAVDEVTWVLVTKVGIAKPPRVLVRFLDDKFEGHEEWVPPGRLQVLWADVDAWQAREDRWKEVGVPSISTRDTRCCFMFCLSHLSCDSTSLKHREASAKTRAESPSKGHSHAVWLRL
jgi:hypothetical protein